MFQALTIITTLTGLFTLLDMVVEKNAKAKIAEYVFGFGNADLAGFENSLIRALLKFFKNNERLSIKKTLFYYSVTVSLLIFLISYFYLVSISTDSKVDIFLTYIAKNGVLFAILPLFFLPFDYWSLWVTNKIFSEEKSPSLPHFFGRVFADLFASIIPTVVIFALVMFLIIEFETVFDPFFIIFAACLGNFFGSLLITIIQLLTLAVGIITRLALSMTRLNQHLAMVTSVHEFPFTFIGLLTGIMGAIVSGFLF